jgi:hypothetical protein
MQDVKTQAIMEGEEKLHPQTRIPYESAIGRPVDAQRPRPRPFLALAKVEASAKGSCLAEMKVAVSYFLKKAVSVPLGAPIGCLAHGPDITLPHISTVVVVDCN